MKWAVGMITSAGRPTPTIERSLASLAAAGWDDVEVREDPAGSWVNWYNLAEKLVA
ncbi:MAG: hypothetical protein GY778_14645, partial [bacterium]|nr:hypothetical protein [bacterium]